MEKIFKFLSFIVILVSFLTLYGCGITSSLITSITASPTTVVVGKTTTISCLASSSSSTGSSSSSGYSYSWSATGGTFLTDSGNPVTWTAPDTPGVYKISATVSDNDGTTSSVSINITVVSSTGESALAPVISSLTASPTTGGPGFSSTLSCIAAIRNSTASGSSENLSYAWSANGGTLSSTSGKSVTWTAPQTVGTYIVTVNVSDGTYTTIGTLNLVVSNSSAASVVQITNLDYSPSILYSGDFATITCTATDSSGLTLSYSWEATGGTIAYNQVNPITWKAPSNLSQETIYQVYVTVSDTAGNKTTSNPLNISVSPSIEAPIITSLTASPSNPTTSTTVSLTCSASDPNSPSRSLTYTWNTSTGGNLGSTTTTTGTNTWSASTAGSYTVTVVVSNGKLSSTYTIPITVTI